MLFYLFISFERSEASLAQRSTGRQAVLYPNRYSRCRAHFRRVFTHSRASCGGGVATVLWTGAGGVAGKWCWGTRRRGWVWWKGTVLACTVPCARRVPWLQPRTGFIHKSGAYCCSRCENIRTKSPLVNTGKSTGKLLLNSFTQHGVP